ncbi:hypothetical protein EIP86_002405 [Pleurotus ostreatoroseus]|nr:hypothetical protein EIP86_002405 [Pleurotus ostreatoroseus]
MIDVGNVHGSLRTFTKLASKVGEALNKDKGKDIRALRTPELVEKKKGETSNRVKTLDGRMCFFNMAADDTFPSTNASSNAYSITTATAREMKEEKAILHFGDHSMYVPHPVTGSPGYGGGASLFPSLLNDSHTTTSSIKNDSSSSESVNASSLPQFFHSDGFLKSGMGAEPVPSGSSNADWVDHTFDYTHLREEDVAWEQVDPRTNYPQYYELSVAFPASFPDYVPHQSGAQTNTSGYYDDDEAVGPDELGRMPKRRRLNDTATC